VTCYALLYTHYLIKLLTEDMLPQMNDSGDLELFLYATDDNHVIATSEKRWLDIAVRGGFPQRVKKV
jgi:predicted nuclease of predicted toxin-antitoxin system